MPVDNSGGKNTHCDTSPATREPSPVIDGREQDEEMHLPVPRRFKGIIKPLDRLNL